MLVAKFLIYFVGAVALFAWLWPLWAGVAFRNAPKLMLLAVLLFVYYLTRHPL